ncbi:hypothetical protein SAMN03159417_04853 [Ralstonia sp. NFACC01]|nr:hypothetical protein SAMN03159417_04853 [Ralstonia sp. NFACC01]
MNVVMEHIAMVQSESYVVLRVAPPEQPLVQLSSFCCCHIALNFTNKPIGERLAIYVL